MRSKSVRNNLILSLTAAAFLTAVTAAGASAQWPTTCVELNDIVEAHLGNHGNVGIYQKTFGDQAEQACQNDHRNDVRSVFAWAIGSTDSATPPATSTPAAPPSAHPSYEATRQAAITRGASEDLATQIANDVIRRGTVDAFLAGTDTTTQYGVKPSTAPHNSGLQAMSTRQFLDYIRNKYRTVDDRTISYKSLSERENKPNEYSDRLSVSVTVHLTKQGEDEWLKVSQTAAELWAEQMLADVRARWPDRHAGERSNQILWSVYLIYSYDSSGIPFNCDGEVWCTYWLSTVYPFDFHITYYYVKAYSYSDGTDSIDVWSYR